MSPRQGLRARSLDIPVPGPVAPEANESRTKADTTVGSHAAFVFHRLLALGDLTALLIAVAISAFVVGNSGRPFHLQEFEITWALMVPVWFLIAYGASLYHQVERRIDYNFVDEIGAVVIASTAWCWLFVLLRSLLVSGPTDLFAPALMWTMMIPLVLFARSLVRRHARRQPWNRRAVATIGDPSGVRALLQRIQRHSEWGLDVRLQIELDPDHRFVVRERDESGAPISHIVVPRTESPGTEAEFGNSKERALAQLVQDSKVDRVIIAGQFQDFGSRTRLIHELIERGVAVDHVSGGPETLYSNAVFHDLEGMPVLSVRPTTPRPFAQRMKRITDVILASTGLIFFSPVLLWAAIRVKLDSKGPVFYRQPRCGQDDKEFELVKLRTMVDGAHKMRSDLRLATEADGNDDVLFKLEDDPRVTKFGGFLRRTSIDELPQLWNVLRGDMSMVGPRPLVFEEALQATDLFAARTRMKPGIAGPWQALGRSSIPFEDMIKLDYSYVVGWSMAEDMRLLLRTMTAVTKRKGAL